MLLDLGMSLQTVLVSGTPGAELGVSHINTTDYCLSYYEN